MEARKLLAPILKWWWLILAATLLAAVVSFAVARSQPRMYRATTKLLVGQSLQSVNTNREEIGTSQQLAQTYVQIAKTQPVLQSTADALALPLEGGALNDRVAATLVGNTGIIELRADDTDPARARAIADELAHQLSLRGPAATETNLEERRAFAQRQARELEAKIDEAQKTIASLQAALLLAPSSEVRDKQAQIIALQTQLNQWQQNYNGLLPFLSPRSPNTMSVIEPASQPDRPVSPNVPLIVGVATLTTFILASAIAYLIEYLDDTLKTPDDVSAYLSLGTLTSVQRLKVGKDLMADDKLVAADLPRSPAAEAYRRLRTNIRFANIDHPPRSILITSAVAGEGKSTTAANLAVVMAQSGLRTVLVDADLRRPSQHTIFDMDERPGLSEALVESSPNARDWLRQSRVENLFVVTSGEAPPNPAELLGSERMRALANELASEHDVVVFDSPPCLPVSDPAILGQIADGVVLVVDSSRTRRDQVAQADEALKKVGARVLGVALNRVKPARRDRYSHYYDAARAPAKKAA